MRPTSAIALAAVVCSLACSGGQQPPPFKPVADVKQLMQGAIDPSADVLWEATGEIITLEGTTARHPKNEEEWAQVRNAAIVLTESGNLLMMVPRAKDGGEWMKRSQELIDVGAAAWKAAEARNVDRLFTIGGDVYEVCSNCHRRYMEAIVNANK
jgi:hypothetical protein